MTTISLDNAVVHDTETYPNVFVLTMECLNNSTKAFWEISPWRDDRYEMMQFLQWLARGQIPMIGFNNEGFDNPVIEYFFRNPQVSAYDIYKKADSIINQQNGNRFGHTLWPSDRFAPQIDLYKIHHFDNKAKTTSLKALQVNMRSESVIDLPFPPGTILTREQTHDVLIPYGQHDTSETKQFAGYSMEAIKFRLSQVEQFGTGVLCWNDTKIGEKILEKRLGDELCYDRSSGSKVRRQTIRTRIALADVIFPYIYFEHPEFQRVHQYLRTKVLESDDIKEFGDEKPAAVKTKGVLTGLTAHVGGIEFCFGTGGIHGSVSSQRIVATDEWLIRDIDVASLYPSIAIVNRLAPAHLGERFVEEYARLPQERKKWQKEKGKKCTEANALKLAANGVYGKSNSQWSVFYDPLVTMSITVNGQLLICMLAEKLACVPSLKLLMINTDGITYSVHKNFLDQAMKIEHEWEHTTKLTLESNFYTRMWIRDVNSYIAEYEG